jgi:hypothetical protein
MNRLIDCYCVVPKEGSDEGSLYRPAARGISSDLRALQAQRITCSTRDPQPSPPRQLSTAVAGFQSEGETIFMACFRIPRL